MGLNHGAALKQMLWDAQVFVLPTHSEGMPNALLEAMAAGLPVISPPVSSIPEIVTEGINGCLVEPGDAEALADAMRRMIDSADSLSAIGAANRARIRDQHSVDHAWRVIAGLL